MTSPTNAEADDLDESARGAVVVAVDGSSANDNAVEWAADEAARLGDRLILLAATGDVVSPTPRVAAEDWAVRFPERVRQLVQRVSDQLQLRHPDLRTARHVHVGGPTSIILEHVADADLVVVGQRGLGAFERLLVGSTSIAVAGRSPVPTVVVPDNWDGVSTRGNVVVGIEPAHTDPALLRQAFERAKDLGVPVTAVFAWRAMPLFDWSPADLDEWRAQAALLLDEIVHPWEAEYPDVEVIKQHPHAHPAGALLDAGEDAQLIIVGRATGEHHVGGFGVGSVTRAVLHYTPCPVMVIPLHRA